MKIVYCATVQPTYGGLRTFNQGLTQSLAKLCEIRNITFEIVAHQNYKEDYSKFATHWFSGNHMVFEQVKLPALLNKLKADVAIFPHNRISLAGLRSVKSACIFHDLLFWRYPKKLPFTKLRTRHFLLKYASNHADFKFAVSEFTAEELAAFNSNCKATVCYQATMGKSNIVPAPLEFLASEHIQKPYFVYLGAHSFQKNLTSLLLAFRAFYEKNPGYQLVIAGGSGTSSLEIRQVMASFKQDVDIVFTGFLTDAEKETVLKNALAFVYPSIYEGFGIPILEAFERDIPVLTTTCASLPEVGGDAVLACDPDAESLEKGLHLLANMSDLERQEMIEKGKQQLAKYSWEQSAEIVLNTLTGKALHT